MTIKYKRNCFNDPAWESSGWGGGWVGDIPTTYIQLVAGVGGIHFFTDSDSDSDSRIL